MILIDFSNHTWVIIMIIRQKRDVHTNLNIYIFILKVFCLFQYSCSLFFIIQNCDEFKIYLMNENKIFSWWIKSTVVPLPPKATSLIRPLPSKATSLIRPLPPKATSLIRPLLQKTIPLIRSDFGCNYPKYY